MNRRAAIAISALLAVSAASAAESQTRSETLYFSLCEDCHGVLGDGMGPVGPALPVKPPDWTMGEVRLDADGNGTAGDTLDLFLVIEQGAAAFGGSPLMASFGSFPQQGDIAGLVDLIEVQFLPEPTGGAGATVAVAVLAGLKARNSRRGRS